ncbi:MAG: energy-coupling factor transporter transmembrane component T [Isosphaeraceae bacterium]
MPAEALASSAAARSPMARLDARWKLIFVLAYIVAVVATPIGQWRILGGLGLLLAFLVGLSGARLEALLLRWCGFLLLVGFIALTIAPGLSARSGHGMATVLMTILAKNSLGFLMLLTLAASTPWAELLRGLRRLGMPVILVGTLQFMERYLQVLGDESRRMTLARRARSFGRRPALSWGMLTSLIGMLFLRSFERSERVHAAMLARGWDGTMRSLEE